MKTSIRPILILILFTSNGLTYAIEKRELKDEGSLALKSFELLGPIFVLLLLALGVFVLFFNTLISKLALERGEHNNVKYIFYNEPESNIITNPMTNYSRGNNNNLNEIARKYGNGDYDGDIIEEEPTTSVQNSNTINSSRAARIISASRVNSTTIQNQIPPTNPTKTISQKIHYSYI